VWFTSFGGIVSVLVFVEGPPLSLDKGRLDDAPPFTTLAVLFYIYLRFEVDKDIPSIRLLAVSDRILIACDIFRLYYH